MRVTEPVQQGRHGYATRPSPAAPSKGGNMASNVIGLFESQSVADQVAQDLETAGFNRRNINRYEGSQDGLENELEREGVAGDDAAYYAEGLRSGGALVSVRANDDQVDDAALARLPSARTSDTRP